MSKQSNAEKQRAYRERKKLQSAQSTAGVGLSGVPVATPAEADSDVPVVEVKEEPPVALSFAERMKQKFAASPGTTAPTKVAAPRTGKGKDNLLVTVLPTLVATLVATYAQNLLAPEYRICAPSQAEVSAVLAPLMAIVGRRVEIVGKASQDAIDLTNSIVSAFAYATRAYIMYVQIKHSKEPISGNTATHPSLDARNQPATSNATGFREYSTAPIGPSAASIMVNGGVGASERIQPEYHDSNGGAVAVNGNSTGRDAEAALIADMFSRDKHGRIGLGLLPRPVREAD